MVRNAPYRRGWSLVELTIILIVLSILCAILAPVISGYVNNAKKVRAREDTGALASSIWMYIEDTANSYFLKDGSPNPAAGASRTSSGSAPQQKASNRVEMLVGDGDIPDHGANGSTRWSRPVNFKEVDFFEFHLVSNKPGNATGNAYRTPTDLDKGGKAFGQDPMFARRESGGFNSEFSWRGPYITAPIDPDPWGNRYMANVMYLDAVADSSNNYPADKAFSADTIVLSAGPDEEVDTLFEKDGLTVGDDDVMTMLDSNSRP